MRPSSRAATSASVSIEVPLPTLTITASGLRCDMVLALRIRYVAGVDGRDIRMTSDWERKLAKDAGLVVEYHADGILGR